MNGGAGANRVSRLARADFKTGFAIFMNACNTAALYAGNLQAYGRIF